MATVIRQCIAAYRFLMDEVADPRTQDYFLLGSPWKFIGILVFYQFFIFKLGPSLMANRPPFKLDRLMQFYNASQVAICSFIFCWGVSAGSRSGLTFRCDPVDYSDRPVALEITRVVWLYYMVKIYDLMDTVFFVLRKKQNQVTFLHVYHHSGMVLGGWIAGNFLSGGHVSFIGIINSLVHVVMYSYYLAASFKLSKLWWKKHITQLQMMQFVLIFLHFSQLIWTDCGFPRWTIVIFLPQNLFMIVLFGDFYYRTYIAKSRKVEQNGVAADAANGKLKAQ